MEIEQNRKLTQDTKNQVGRDWLVEDGLMAPLIRSMDWSKSPLGDRKYWSYSLRTAVNMILSTHFPMAILWGEELILIYNDGYSEIAANKHPVAMGRSTREIWPEAWEFNKPVFEQVMKLGKTLTFKDQLFILNRKSESEETYFTLCYSPIKTNDGKIGGSLVVLQETTRYVLTERKLIENMKFLESIIESTPSDVFAMDDHQRFSLVNNYMAQFYGKVGKELIGKTLYDLFPREVADRLHAANETILKTGSPLRLEEEIIRPSGIESRTMITSKFPIRNSEGKVVGVGGVATDITEHKKLESELREAKVQAEDLAKAKAKFLDTAAHELRNPVAVISLLLQLFQEKIKKGEMLGQNQLNRLKEPIDRLSRLIVDLLDVSRLERGLVTLRPVPIDLSALISKSLEDFKLIAPKRNFIFERPKHPIELNLDPLRIEQVLTNLLDNAVKYTSEASPIAVELQSNHEAVRVSIHDRGNGIPKEHLKVLFTAFSRGKSEETMKTCGLGLGLSVCRGVIELHGGTIGVESEPGKGSTFYFDLPLKSKSDQKWA